MTHNFKVSLKNASIFLLTVALLVLAAATTVQANNIATCQGKEVAYYYSGDLAVLNDIIVANNLEQYRQKPEMLGIQVWQDGRLTFLMFTDNNMVSVLPQSIGNLTELRGLYLSNQNLSHLPETIGQLSNLESLHADNNQLQTLPESIGNLHFLKSLYVQNNQLVSLPYTIENLSHLKTLNVSGNKLNNTAFDALPLNELSEFYQ
ncbi:leucine-rich repeat domain-containing protein [Sphingobacteriales bacterium UPWRP_1]|nr:hypothetical protein B6N25_06310 [Sphingobacteriales bacterium TSM_CSS]PSJ74722.1 leucine-rich repeat domain-containing protein [Sphingobacteriales bacterium UPWRP_1]